MSKICRVQCLSDLARLQRLGPNGGLARLAACSSTSGTPAASDNGADYETIDNEGVYEKRALGSLRPGYQCHKSTEELLQEKDEEIRKMQQMLRAMQDKLNTGGEQGLLGPQPRRPPVPPAQHHQRMTSRPPPDMP